MTAPAPSVVRYGYTDTPIGRMLVAGSRDALVGLYLDQHAHTPARDAGWEPDDGELDDVREQLAEYFARTRTDFDLTVRPAGSDFQLAVWSELQEIPFGQTRSYGDIARRLGCPNAVRAVGAANGRNPISLVIPCHRVIGTDGTLTGYGWGVERKRWLLDHERRAMTS